MMTSKILQIVLDAYIQIFYFFVEYNINCCSTTPISITGSHDCKTISNDHPIVYNM